VLNEHVWSKERLRDWKENGKCTNVTNCRSRVGLSTSFYSDHCHIAFLFCISNSWVLTKPVKIGQSEGIPNPSILERPFVKSAHRHSCTSLATLLPIFSFAVFHTVPQLTECLEEASPRWTGWLLVLSSFPNMAAVLGGQCPLLGACLKWCDPLLVKLRWNTAWCFAICKMGFDYIAISILQGISWCTTQQCNQ